MSPPMHIYVHEMKIQLAIFLVNYRVRIDRRRASCRCLVSSDASGCSVNDPDIPAR